MASNRWFVTHFLGQLRLAKARPRTSRTMVASTFVGVYNAAAQPSLALPVKESAMENNSGTWAEYAG
jgi:hypothetical protein